MKICIFGADGRTGQEVVREALKQKHEVVASIYRSPRKDLFPPSVNIQVGNVIDETYVLNTLIDVDVVISVIGHVKGSDPLMQTKGVRNIITSMNTHNIRRLISLTGTGVRVSGDTPSLLDKVGNIIIKLIDRERIIDGIKHFDVIKKSGLDWTVLRVLKLSQSPKQKQDYHLTDHGPAENMTSRKKVAKILIDLASNNTFIEKAPVVSE